MEKLFFSVTLCLGASVFQNKVTKNKEWILTFDAMLFDIRYFEQLLEEAPLKKGLMLFESGKVAFIEKLAGNEFHFVINKTVQLTLKKRADKLMGYACSCRKHKYCEHLAAVLFYFQQDALGLSVKKKPARKPTVSRTSYDAQVVVLKEWVKPFMELKAMSQFQLDEINAGITKLKTEAQNNEDLFDLHLALVTVVPMVLQLRLLGNEAPLKQNLSESLNALKLTFDKGLTRSQQAKWYKATLESVKNNAVLRSEAYTFFIPRALIFITEKLELDRLATLLNNRSYKPGYANRFDKLHIAKLEVDIRNHGFIDSLVKPQQPETVEFIIAAAELYFCSHHASKAFEHLLAHDALIKEQYFFYYSAFIDYMIQQAREENKTNIELTYLKKSFVYNAHILPGHLDRFITLTPAGNLRSEVDALIVQLNKIQSPVVFDKVTDLLFRTGRYDELIKEIKRQSNKFSLLHKILLKKLPHYDADSIRLYLKHLLEAFSEAGFYHFQQHTYNKAKEYLDQLPADIKTSFITDLLDHIGRNKQISRHILSLE